MTYVTIQKNHILFQIDFFGNVTKTRMHAVATTNILIAMHIMDQNDHEVNDSSKAMIMAYISHDTPPNAAIRLAFAVSARSLVVKNVTISVNVMATGRAPLRCPANSGRINLMIAASVPSKIPPRMKYFKKARPISDALVVMSF